MGHDISQLENRIALLQHEQDSVRRNVLHTRKKVSKLLKLKKGKEQDCQQAQFCP